MAYGFSNLCTFTIMLSMCDIDTMRKISVTSRLQGLYAECLKKELQKRAQCCLTHAQDLSLWVFGYPEIYKHAETGEYTRRLVGNHMLDQGWKLVPVLAMQCRYCEDFHYLERTGSWLTPGNIQREGLMRRSVLDRYNVAHPGSLMIAACIDAIKAGPMRPVVP